MTVMRSVLLQLSQHKDKTDDFNVPAEMAAIMFAELREMVKILVESENSSDMADEDETVMIVSEARQSCFQLLRLLRSIRSEACDAMALRNVRYLCDLFRHGDGRLQRRVSEMLLSILSKNEDTKSALTDIFKMLWSCIQDHVVMFSDVRQVETKKKARRAIIRLDYQTCSRLLSMTRANWKKTRHSQAESQQHQPPEIHVRVVSASELQRLSSTSLSSSTLCHAGQWGVRKCCKCWIHFSISMLECEQLPFSFSLTHYLSHTPTHSHTQLNQVLKRVRNKTRVAVVRFETEDGTRDNVAFLPEALRFVCDMKTVLELDCRDSRRFLSSSDTTTNSTSEKKEDVTNCSNSKWERVDQDGRWKAFANSDAAKLESAWKRMKPLVHLGDRHVVDLSRMVVSSIAHVDSNEDGAATNEDNSSSGSSNGDRSNVYSVKLSSSSDVMLGKTALSHNESITTFLSCSRIRRRQVTTSEDDEFENKDMSMPTRVRRVVVEIDNASRTSVCASEATRLVRLLLEKDTTSLSSQVLSHLERGLESARHFVNQNKNYDILTNAIVATNILDGLVEPLRVGGSVVRRDVPLHRDDKGTLVYINDNDLSVIWNSSNPARIETMRVHTVRAVSATDTPVHIIQRAIPILMKLAAELVNMPIESISNSSRQLLLSTWRGSVLKSLCHASRISELSDIIYKELHSNLKIRDSLCAHAAKACAIPVLPTEVADLEVLISQGRIALRRRRLLDDDKQERKIVVAGSTKEEESSKKETTSSSTKYDEEYVRAATSLSEHLGLSVDFCVLALERCDGNVNVAADFMFSNLESADSMIAQRKARLEKQASQKRDEEARRNREKEMKMLKLKQDDEARQKEIERRIEAYSSGKHVESADEVQRRRCGLNDEKTVFELDHDILKERANVFKPKGTQCGHRRAVMRRNLSSSQARTSQDRFTQQGDESVGLVVDFEDKITVRTPPVSQTNEFTFLPSSCTDTCVLEELSLSNLEQTLGTTFCRDMLRVVMVRQGLLHHDDVLRNDSESSRSSSDSSPYWIKHLLHILLLPMIHVNGSEIWFCDANVRAGINSENVVGRNMVMTVSRGFLDGFATLFGNRSCFLEHASTLLRVAAYPRNEFMIRDWLGRPLATNVDAVAFHEPSVTMATILIGVALRDSCVDVLTNMNLLKSLGDCIGTNSTTYVSFLSCCYIYRTY